MSIEREQINATTLRLTSGGCSFTYERLKPGVLLVTIRGDDHGQFGTATIDEVNAEFERFGPLALLVDTTEASGPTTAVMEAWTAYFAANRKKLKTVCILVNAESKLLHLTVRIVKHLSGTGGLLQIVDERKAFEEMARRNA
ncbi:MAG TPA: hypothetical protein VEJ63_16735 [Planctomycetota bacterium]|nr:hypothetical protein [Planctomycetota bacterium]